jgi:peptidoglycan/LPS O-acetylase OafA/YrhL
MLSSFWGSSARAHGRNPSDMLPLHEGQPLEDNYLHDQVGKMEASGSTATAGDSTTATPTTPSRDKIKCLDGLRGIACLIVFNYHFLWPWTPSIMLGHGALPPLAPEPFRDWTSLPIICLLKRGRPMVAIFFAISGYVLCRHILRSIRERRIDAAYRRLASSVFRRVFRLYIPPAVSMFIVAILAQTGAFRSEEDIYMGPDSIYINGSVTIVNHTSTCVNGTSIVGAAGLVDYLSLESSYYLGNVTQWTDQLCVNRTSRRTSPADLYKAGDGHDPVLLNETIIIGWEINPNSTLAKTNKTDPVFIQYGGSWEEHPFIHDNMTYALKNFTRSYAEWANPFNFGHYHPRYDPHTFTIPMELRGSMVIYIFLLGTAALKAKWRLSFAGILTAYSLTLGRWDVATFMGGAVMSEVDIAHSLGQTAVDDRALPGNNKIDSPRAIRRYAILRWMTIVLALYLLSYPDAGAEYTPGYAYLSEWVPRYYIPLAGWMFYQSMGALLLLPCVLRSPFLRHVLETRPAQYMGRVSFSFYLVHGPVLHGLGFWIMPTLFDVFGLAQGLFIGYVVLLGVTFVLTGWFYKKVDIWSSKVGSRIESALVI